ncbi:hypothetical protein GUJ93_ZPchr0005g16152 [Zizania palustris]|uniref:Uncharacterized protein n=1 Tax=Zizania palustris TaxID=103762 RepID=A0A8J5T4Q8_ZIZPA|nr:hypothetical protein GUJ93_ZPchr0005g16152 [Zizania palustris]
MSGGDDDITVHVDWLARNLMRKQAEAASDEEHRIMVNSHRLSRVPAHLRDANDDAYTPRFVAIGPLHRGAARRLGAGERLKMAYLHNLISRGHSDPSRQFAVIQEYIRVVTARERDARAFYSEDVDMNTEEFIQMLVLDGCFIVEHLVNVAIGREEPSLHATPFGPLQLSVDLILAENQIPFFVLVDLFRNTKLPDQLFNSTGNPPPVLLVNLVLYYLAGEKGRKMGEAVPPLLPAVDVVHHILHLLHAMVTVARTKWEPQRRIQDGAVLGTAQEVARLLRRLPLLLLVPILYPILPEERKWRASYGREDVPSASDLKRMWVRFNKPPRGSGVAVASIASVMGPVPLAMTLAHEDRLRLPQLRVEFRTAPLLLNLMAFEQAAEVPEKQEVSAYVSFMAKMVQSSEDAGALTAAEVVVHGHSGASGESKEDVARLFRQVGAASEVVELERSYLRETLVKLRERSQHPLFNMWADVQRNYFTVPWAVVAEFVAFVTFVSTIVQMYSSFHQN